MIQFSQVGALPSKGMYASVLIARRVIFCGMGDWVRENSK
jgi:hypothetical protein